MRLSVQARAKINWTLDILGKRPDGYHELDMLMQSVTLCDQMTFETAEELSLRVQKAGGRYVPADHRNLVLRAAEAFKKETGYTGGAKITLSKYIPVSAGMGGGSSDAAATLQALNLLWQTNLSEKELEQVGLSIGADVPFCVQGGLQRAQGIGEVLTPLPSKKPMWLLALQPCRGLSTRDVFMQYTPSNACKPDTKTAMDALIRGDARKLGPALGNVLEPVACVLRPEILEAIDALTAEGACGARMTGSGSAVFGLFAQPGICRRAGDKLSKRWASCRMMRTASCGVVLRRND